jgi:hypothetical protein
MFSFPLATPSETGRFPFSASGTQRTTPPNVNRPTILGRVCLQHYAQLFHRKSTKLAGQARKFVLTARFSEPYHRLAETGTRTNVLTRKLPEEPCGHPPKNSPSALSFARRASIAAPLTPKSAAGSRRRHERRCAMSGPAGVATARAPRGPEPPQPPDPTIRELLDAYEQHAERDLYSENPRAMSSLRTSLKAIRRILEQIAPQLRVSQARPEIYQHYRVVRLAENPQISGSVLNLRC